MKLKKGIHTGVIVGCSKDVRSGMPVEHFDVLVWSPRAVPVILTVPRSQRLCVKAVVASNWALRLRMSYGGLKMKIWSS